MLLDTHVLVWLRFEPRRLTARAATAIRRLEARRGLAIAAFSLLELAQLAHAGELGSGTVRGLVEHVTQGLTVLPLNAEIAAQAAQFGPAFPRDPADRIIAATALAHGLTLVTADQKIRGSGLVPTLW